MQIPLFQSETVPELVQSCPDARFLVPCSSCVSLLHTAINLCAQQGTYCDLPNAQYLNLVQGFQTDLQVAE